MSTRRWRQGVDVKEARADDLHTFQWSWYPEDTLDVLDLLLVYSGVHERLARPLVNATLKTQWPNKKISVQGRRCVHPMAIKSACLLLHFCRGRDSNERGIWFLHKNAKYKERLRDAGINPDTVQVEDKSKWAIAWWQLTHKNWSSFKGDVQQKLIAKGFKAPEPQPQTVHKTYVKKDSLKRIYSERKLKKTKASEVADPAPDYENEPPPPPTIGAMLAAQRNSHDVIRMR